MTATYAKAGLQILFRHRIKISIFVLKLKSDSIKIHRLKTFKIKLIILKSNLASNTLHRTS